MKIYQIITVILLIISISLISYGFYEKTKDRSNQFVAINANIIDAYISSNQKTTRREISSNVYSTSTQLIYDVHVVFNYKVNYQTYTSRRLMNTVNSYSHANELVQYYMNKRKTIKIFYNKKYPSVPHFQISKNNAPIYFIAGAIFMIFAISVFIRGMFFNFLIDTIISK